MIARAAPKWIIQTKLSPPKLPSDLVNRDRLLEKFSRCLAATLSLIHAPAGYGKTTLLKQWYDQSKSVDATTIWLSLDEGDGPIDSFSHYLYSALNQAGLKTPSLSALFNRQSEQDQIKRLAANLIDLVINHQRKVVIFLDDFHKLLSPAINALMTELVSHPPDNLHIIIASRQPLTIATQQLKHQQTFYELDATELKLSINEFEELLSSEIDTKNLHYVWDRIEGWPIAARIVNHSLEQGLISAEHISSFSGKTKDLGEYISHEIFASLQEEEKDFLLRTCLCSRFTQELADQTDPTQSSHRIINTLAQMNVFLVALDNEDQWYRYHHMFQEYLEKKIHTEQADRISAIRSANSQWLADNGYFQEAIDQALLSKELGTAGKIMDSFGLWHLTIHGNISLAKGYLGKLPTEILNQHPTLIIMEIFVQIKAGKIAYAKQKLEHFIANSDDISTWQGKDIDDPTRAILTTLTTCNIDAYLDTPVTVESLDKIHRLLSTINPQDHAFIYSIHEFLGSAYREMGDVDTALFHHEKSLTAASQLDSNYADIYVFFHLAEVYLQKLDFNKALLELKKAEKMISQPLKNDPDLSYAYHVFLARASYLKGDFANASQIIENHLTSTEKEDSWLSLYIMHFDTLVGIELAKGHYSDAQTLITQSKLVAKERLLARLEQFSELLLIKTDIIKHKEKFDIDSHLATLADIEQQVAEVHSTSVLIPAQLSLCKVRLLAIANHNQEAEHLVDQIISEFKQSHQDLLIVEAYLLKAYIVYKQGELNQALKYCRLATIPSIPEDYKLAHIEAMDLLLPLYQAAIEDFEEPACSFIKEIIKLSKKMALKSQRHGLTEREHATVIELAKGLSNREIGDRLFISEDAVKYRLKSIFKKWQVTNREEAIKKALSYSPTEQ